MVENDSAKSSPPAPASTSGMALVAFICAISVCCPLMPLLAVLLGIRALAEINAHPQLGGARLAKFSIGLGVAAIVAWIAGAVWWHFNARVPMIHGPQREFEAGFAGDIIGFKSGFTEPGATASDQEAREFINEIRSRYGEFRGSAQSLTPKQTASMSGRPVLPISYTLQFERQAIEADAAFITFGESRGVLPNVIFKWHWIRVNDPVRGDLVYPQALAAEVATSAPAPTTAPATQPNALPSLKP